MAADPTRTIALRTLIVDDEPLAVERLQLLCARRPELVLAGTANDGAAALRLVEALRPDLLLLDIAMPGLDGIAVAHALSAAAHRPAVIFVTAFDRFAVAAFDVAAVGYLLKPVAEEALVRAVGRVAGTLATQEPAAAAPSPAPRYTEEFWVPHRAEVVRVAAAEIERIEAERDYMRLHLPGRSLLIHATISDLERQLDPARFVRLHRSTIVRRDRVAKLVHDGLGGWSAVLTDGAILRIGRTYLATAKAIAGR